MPRKKPARTAHAFRVRRSLKPTLLLDSIDIYCAETDRRLAALKRRYAANRRVIEVLRGLEEKIE